jgi:hypothetical protein
VRKWSSQKAKPKAWVFYNFLHSYIFLRLQLAVPEEKLKCYGVKTLQIGGISPHLSFQEIMLQVSCAIQDDKFANNKFRPVKQGY